VALTVDSNILGGEITAITSTIALDENLAPAQILDMGLLSPSTGWILQDRILQDNHLLLTADSGSRWGDITPDLGNATILAIEFRDSHAGWLLANQVLPDSEDTLLIFHTLDGGTTWESFLLPQISQPIAAGHLDFIDAQNGWLLLQFQSGSSFSLGRLFFTQDAGRTWEERSTPLGAPMEFIDSQRGWVSGGPAGDLIFHTFDGGHTWQAVDLPDLPVGKIWAGLPQFDTLPHGNLPVTVSTVLTNDLVIYETVDGGDTWAKSSRLNLGAAPLSGPVVFSHRAQYGWTPALTSLGLYTLARDQNPERLAARGLPQGIAALDFISAQTGWAIVQTGSCQGEKISPHLESPFNASSLFCGSQTRLFMTQDGGDHWLEITP